MYYFGQVSESNLITCHPDLQKVARRLILVVDCKCTGGFRGQEEQDEALRTGLSELKWPTSKHNQRPSLAFDLAPCPIKWDMRDKINAQRWLLFGLFVLATAKDLGIRLRWGHDWDQDGDLWDQKFYDLPHFELV